MELIELSGYILENCNSKIIWDIKRKFLYVTFKEKKE